MLQNKIQPESIKWLRPSNVAKTNATSSKRLNSNAVSTKFTLAFPSTLSSLFSISATSSYNDKWQEKQQIKKLWNFCFLMLHNFYGQSVSGPVMLQNKIQPESIKWLRPSYLGISINFIIFICHLCNIILQWQMTIKTTNQKAMKLLFFNAT